jgi:hypothetical protein
VSAHDFGNERKILSAALKAQAQNPLPFGLLHASQARADQVLSHLEQERRRVLRTATGFLAGEVYPGVRGLGRKNQVMTGLVGI